MREGFLKLIEYNSSRLCEVKLEFLRVLVWLFHGGNDFAIFPNDTCLWQCKVCLYTLYGQWYVLNVAGILTHPVFSIAAGIKSINCSHYNWDLKHNCWTWFSLTTCLVWYFIFHSSVRCMILREMWNLLAIFRLWQLKQLSRWRWSRINFCEIILTKKWNGYKPQQLIGFSQVGKTATFWGRNIFLLHFVFRTNGLRVEKNFSAFAVVGRKWRVCPPPDPPSTPHQWDLARVKLKRNEKNINLYLSATLNGFFGDDETELRISTGLG